MWVYPVQDKAGNINDSQTNINTAYFIETYIFIDNIPTLYNVIAKEALAGGVAKLYTREHNDTYNEIGTKNIYYFNGSNSTQAAEVLSKNNVIFAGFCWQMVRTTDTGGVKLIYNGKIKEEIETVPISESEYNITSNDTSYPYTYDNSTNTWASTMKTHSSSGTIIFTIKTAGDYYLNYTVSSEANYDKATFYKNGTQIGQYSGSATGTIKLEELNTTDEIKVIYSKNSSGSSGSDNVIFYVGKSNGEVEQICNNSGTEQQIGNSMFNAGDSLAYAGYMYNTVYLLDNKSLATREVIFPYYSVTLSTNYWYADSISYDTSTGKYSLVNPYKVSSTSDYASLNGKYTFFKSDETYTSSSVKYIGSVSNSRCDYFEVNDGNTIEYYDDVYTYGTSYTKNEDGTYTINEPSTVQKTTYSENYRNLNRKYVCKNAINNSCDTLWFVTDYTSSTFDWISPKFEYKFAKGFTYSASDNKYTLNDESVIIWNFGDSDEREKLRNAHYTCFNTTGECETIAYVYYQEITRSHHIKLNNGKSIEEAIQDMLSADDVNKTNSIIKNTIDKWYENNMTNYTKYLEDTVFCNDRIVYSYSSFNPDGGSITGDFSFKTNTYVLYCPNVTDRFSVENEKAKLTYPVGIMSRAEMDLLNNDNIRKTGNWYWVSSPGAISTGTIRGRVVDSRGDIYSTSQLSSSLGVRPSVSLKPNTRYAAGTGSTTDPYIVDVSAPTLTQETLIDGEREKTVRITVSDDYDLSNNNQYKYYLSTSETELTGGEWKDYTPGEIFTLAGENETKYLWIYPVMDNAGNINDSKSDVNTPYVLSTIIFKNKQTLYNVLRGESASGSGLAKLYEGEHNDAYDETGTQNIYHFYGADSTAATSILSKNNVVFGGFCWQMIRTTDTGGTKLIYNGVPETVPTYLDKNSYNVTTNSSDSYTFNDDTNEWANTIGSDTAYTLTYTVVEAGDYSLIYDASDLNDYNMYFTFTVNDGIKVDYIPEVTGSATGTIDLGYLSTTDVLKAIVTVDGAGEGSGDSTLKFKMKNSNSKDKYLCNNSGTKQQIGTSAFNENYDSPAYVGYMYNTIYQVKSKSMTSTDVYKYANSFTYSNGTYKLSNDAISIDVTSIEYTKLDNAHYTCFNTTGECNTIYYIFSFKNGVADYIELNGGKSVENALNEMLSADNVNKTNSTIKDTIDTWYANNMTNYTKYLEDTVFCNDRSISDYGGWNPNGGSISNDLLFKNYNYSTSDLYCTNVTDRFSVGNEKARLTYKIGLMSAPEMYLLGNNSIRKTKQYYWLSSPYQIYYYAFELRIHSDGRLYFSDFVDRPYGVRPAVSLKSTTEYYKGTGTTTDPYVIKVSN